MRTTPITKDKAYALLREAGQKPVLPYRGYATAINSTDRVSMAPDGTLWLITADTKQFEAYSDPRAFNWENTPNI